MGNSFCNCPSESDKSANIDILINSSYNNINENGNNFINNIGSRTNVNNKKSGNLEIINNNIRLIYNIETIFSKIIIIGFHAFNKSII